MLEPCAVKVARTVLRGGWRGDMPSLPDWLRFLKSDPKALVIAGAQAQRASDFILGWSGVEQVEADAETAEAGA